MTELRRYTRWTHTEDTVTADLLGLPPLTADPATGKVHYDGRHYDPDEARLIGVRLIEAAVIADAGRAIRIKT